MQDALDSTKHGMGRTFEEIADRTEIVVLLQQIATAGSPVFAAQAGTKETFVSRLDAVEPQRGSFGIIELTGRGTAEAYETGTWFDMFAATGDADVFFETALIDVNEGPRASYLVAIPDMVRRIKRRAEPRGRSFASWAVRLRSKHAFDGQGVTARLRDISIDGVGLVVPPAASDDVAVGSIFDDCLLLVRDMPIATCALEIAHVRDDPLVAATIAGARFLDLDDLARTRIAKLVAAARSEI